MGKHALSVVRLYFYYLRKLTMLQCILRKVTKNITAASYVKPEKVWRIEKQKAEHFLVRHDSNLFPGKLNQNGMFCGIYNKILTNNESPKCPFNTEITEQM